MSERHAALHPGVTEYMRALASTRALSVRLDAQLLDDRAVAVVIGLNRSPELFRRAPYGFHAEVAQPIPNVRQLEHFCDVRLDLRDDILRHARRPDQGIP